MSYCGKFTYREYNLILEIASFVFLVLFKDVGGRRVSPRFYLFISDINQGKRRGEFKISLHDPRNGQILLRCSVSC